MLFIDIVSTSRAVAEAAGRLDKVGRIAALLRRLDPDEIEPVGSWLSGSPRQGRIGLGYATISAIDARPADQAQLTVREVDAALGSLAGLSGPGVTRERARLLGALFERATHDALSVKLMQPVRPMLAASGRTHAEIRARETLSRRQDAGRCEHYRGCPLTTMM